jgi:transposase
MGRVIGLDLSKHTAEVAMLLPDQEAPVRGRFSADPASIRQFARGLNADDQVALESCTNAFAFQRLLCEHAGRVVVSNPLKTRVIAEAKVKTDKVDAEILARLLAADFLPPVWVPDAAIDQLRHLVFHRQGLVTQRTQAKNRIHAILYRNLITPEMSDLFGRAGRKLLDRVELPEVERRLLEADLRAIDFMEGEIKSVERDLARIVHQDPDVRRLMTVPGLALVSAVGLKAAIGDVRRFKAAPNLVSYFGLNPAVYQSGLKAYNGHISRRGRSHARSVCVEVAHQLVKAPGPFRVFFERLRRRKPYNVALTAVARKLTVLVWHMLTTGEDYRYAPPARTREKLMRLDRLAADPSAPKRLRARSVPKRPQDTEVGLAAEREYEAFLRDRFPENAPKTRKKPTHPQSKRPSTST